MDQIVLGLQGAYLGIGAVFAGYIISRTWWDHWKTAVPGALIALAMLWLWLPAIIITGLLVWWAFWMKGRRANRRFDRGVLRRRNWMKAVKDKHNVDDAEVLGRVIEEIKAGER